MCRYPRNFPENKDTEKISLPPIEHVEAHGHIVEMDLAADPIHHRFLSILIEK